MKLCDKIAKLRKRKGLSQEELANELDVSRQSVFKWEAGENTPDINKIKKLAKLFDVSFDVLLDDEIDLNGAFDTNEKSSSSANRKKSRTTKKSEIAVAKKKILWLIPLFVVRTLLLTSVLTLTTIKTVKQVQIEIEQRQIEEANKKSAQKVIDLIDAIGEVTLSSTHAIIWAENSYAQLTPEQKAFVTNYDVLVQARSQYEKLQYYKREEETKDDPTRTIVLTDLNGQWKSSAGAMGMYIEDYDSCKSVIWFMNDYPTSVSSIGKNSSIVGYNNLTRKMEFILYHYYLHTYYLAGMTKSSEGELTLFLGRYDYHKR